MEDFKAKVLERNLNPYHSFLSSFFAGLGELGMLNQGSVNIVSRRAAEYLYSYLEAKELLPNPAFYANIIDLEALKYIINHINEILSLLGSYRLQMSEPKKAVFLIDSSYCRICPKGVGGAEIKGTICPIPSFVGTLVNLIMGHEKIVLLTKGIEKEGITCKAEYKIN